MRVTARGFSIGVGAVSVRGRRTDRCRTKKPDRGRASMTALRSSCRYAWLTVEMDTPRPELSDRNEGSRSPKPNAPAPIMFMMCFSTA